MRHGPLKILLSGFVASLVLCLSAAVGTSQDSTSSMPPTPPSPINEFRRWLSQNSAEQSASLASKTPEQRAYLIVKLAEYGALSVVERETRLQALELTWYLRPLMDTPSATRAAAVARIPVKYRTLVQERLREWDALPGELKKDVLENEWTMHYFMRVNADPAQREELLRKANPGQRKAFEEKIARWDGLSPERRDRMFYQFNRFFQLPQTERVKTLNVMSESERAEMEGTLRAFQALPAAQRKVCIESFEKFTNMKPEQRREFFRDAQRWQAMSEKERKAWKNLVTALPPMPDTTTLPPMPRSLPPALPMASNSPSSTLPVQ